MYDEDFKIKNEWVEFRRAKILDKVQKLLDSTVH